jgi:hypothetical protein
VLVFDVDVFDVLVFDDVSVDVFDAVVVDVVVFAFFGVVVFSAFACCVGFGDGVFGVFAFVVVVLVVLPLCAFPWTVVFVAELPFGVCIFAALGGDFVVAVALAPEFCFGGLPEPPPLPCAKTWTFESRTRTATAVATLTRFMMDSPSKCVRPVTSVVSCWMPLAWCWL